MSCTLATLAACFGWSNLYLDTAIRYQNREDFRVEATAWTQNPCVRDGVDSICVWQYGATTDQARNPYVHLSLGYEIDLRSLTVGLEASHISSPRAGWDKGVNALELRTRWYPFRK